jgi:hypothetical protein
VEVYNAQIEKGSTATDYEPYKSDTYTIKLSDEAGTVYSGTLNPVTGDLVVDWIVRQLKSFTISGGGGTYFYTNTADKAFGITNIISSIYKTVNTSASEMPQGSIKGHGSNKNIYIMDTRYSTGSELIAAEGDQQIALQLETPLTYHLDKEEITTLLGSNTFTTDAKTLDLTYRKDLGLYIKKLIETT